MKFIAGLPILLVIALMATFQVSVSSCEKGDLVRDTIVIRDTITITDTLQLKDTAISTALLASTPWKLQELRALQDNYPIYYLRGSNESTLDFDQEYVVFNSDKTGTYFDSYAIPFPLTWDFANASQTSIQFTIQYPSGPRVVTWEHIIYRNGAIRYGEYYKDGSVNTNAQGIRIPKSATTNANMRL